MNKILFSFFASLILCLELSGQTPAPDFTATDIHGVEHNLHDYLDAGKIVILDVSATWCPPCWSFHEAHYLEDIHTTFGPDGTDEIVVLFYEGDPDTDNADLIGTGDNTLGNWTAGVSYPIIDEPDVSDDFLDIYAPLGFPTVSVICPNSKEIIGDVYDQDLAGILEKALECGSLNLSDIKMEGYTGPAGTCEEEIELTVSIKNTGTTDFENFEVTAGTGGIQFASVTYDQILSAGSTANINFGNYSLTNSSTEFQFELKVDDDFFSENNVSASTVSKAAITNNLIRVYIEADEYTDSDPTRWSIQDDAGNIIVQGAPLAPSTTYDETFNISNRGCYKFVIEDGYEDGLNTPIRISDSQNEVIFDNSNFGARGEGYFDVRSLSNVKKIIEAESIRVFPSPVSEILNLQWFGVENGDAQIQIINAAGQMMSNQNLKIYPGENALKIPVTVFPKGIYFIKILSGESFVNKRFVKQ